MECIRGGLVSAIVKAKQVNSGNAKDDKQVPEWTERGSTGNTNIRNTDMLYNGLKTNSRSSNQSSGEQPTPKMSLPTGSTSSLKCNFKFVIWEKFKVIT